MQRCSWCILHPPQLTGLCVCVCVCVCVSLSVYHLTSYEVFASVVTGGFHQSLNDSKFSEITRTPFSILTEPRRPMIGTVSSLIQISSSTSLIYWFFKNVPRLRLVSLLTSYSIAFPIFLKVPCLCPVFHFPFLLTCDPLER